MIHLTSCLVWLGCWPTQALGAVSDQSDRTTHQEGLSSHTALLSRPEIWMGWGRPPLTCQTESVGLAPRCVYGFRRIVSAPPGNITAQGAHPLSEDRQPVLGVLLSSRDVSCGGNNVLVSVERMV